MVGALYKDNETHFHLENTAARLGIVMSNVSKKLLYYLEKLRCLVQL